MGKKHPRTVLTPLQRRVNLTLQMYTLTAAIIEIERIMGQDLKMPSTLENTQVNGTSGLLKVASMIQTVRVHLGTPYLLLMTIELLMERRGMMKITGEVLKKKSMILNAFLFSLPMKFYFPVNSS